MKIKIGNQTISRNDRVFIVAELGINHNGKLELAKKMISQAKKAGADAVKIQSFVTEEFIFDKSLTYSYKKNGRKITESQYQMFKRYEMSRSFQQALFDYARKLKIILFSTPQDNSFKTVDLLCSSKINVPAIKIGSDDLANLPLLAYCARKKKPMIISTGMATLPEIKEAVKTIESQGNKKIIILKCTSLYPTPPAKADLNQIKTLLRTFDYPIGYSDHTAGTLASAVAVAMGARVIEKHFTLSKKMAGPDHHFSADFKEMSELVKQVRAAEELPGNPNFILSAEEKRIKAGCRMSLTVAKAIKKGEVINKEHLTIKRPGTGLPPKYLKKALGKKAKTNMSAGYLIKLKDF